MLKAASSDLQSREIVPIKTFLTKGGLASKIQSEGGGGLTLSPPGLQIIAPKFLLATPDFQTYVAASLIILIYRKVASSNTFCLEAHAGF